VSRCNDNRDYQQSAVYRWEDMVIARLDRSQVKFKDIQPLVNYVWQQEGLLYPPKVVPFHKNMKRLAGTGSRTQLQFPAAETTPTWIILHEIAHSMTSNFEGLSHMHNENYVGVYMKLVAMYLRADLMMLEHTAIQMGVKYNLNAKPSFID
jgi:hypothetical protein